MILTEALEIERNQYVYGQIEKIANYIVTTYKSVHPDGEYAKIYTSLIKAIRSSKFNILDPVFVNCDPYNKSDLNKINEDLASVYSENGLNKYINPYVFHDFLCVSISKEYISSVSAILSERVDTVLIFYTNKPTSASFNKNEKILSVNINKFEKNNPTFISDIVQSAGLMEGLVSSSVTADGSESMEVKKIDVTTTKSINVEICMYNRYSKGNEPLGYAVKKNNKRLGDSTGTHDTIRINVFLDSNVTVNSIMRILTHEVTHIMDNERRDRIFHKDENDIYNDLKDKEVPDEKIDELIKTYLRPKVLGIGTGMSIAIKNGKISDDGVLDKEFDESVTYDGMQKMNSEIYRRTVDDYEYLKDRNASKATLQKLFITTSDYNFELPYQYIIDKFGYEGFSKNDVEKYLSIVTEIFYRMWTDTEVNAFRTNIYTNGKKSIPFSSDIIDNFFELLKNKAVPTAVYAYIKDNMVRTAIKYFPMNFDTCAKKFMAKTSVIINRIESKYQADLIRKKDMSVPVKSEYDLFDTLSTAFNPSYVRMKSREDSDSFEEYIDELKHDFRLFYESSTPREYYYRLTIVKKMASIISMFDADFDTYFDEKEANDNLLQTYPRFKRKFIEMLKPRIYKAELIYNRSRRSL